jgi:serine/threonine-protein kinase
MTAKVITDGASDDRGDALQPAHAAEVTLDASLPATDGASQQGTHQETLVEGSLSSAAAEPPPISLAIRSQQPAAHTLERIFGQGGLGRVWLAVDRDLHRHVALKEMQPGRADHPDAVRSFLREAQITGQLEHPNIVPVYQAGVVEGTQKPYYTMRLVHGQTLREAIHAFHESATKGRLDRIEQRRLLSAFTSVCNALAYAHSRGVVHRDLKPANVVLGEFGEVIVLDWGLAKLLAASDESAMSSESGAPKSEAVAVSEEASSQTAMGSVSGTPAYMAPEQAAGQPGQIDARTDIYGLGAILFEILTGRAPRQGASFASLMTEILEGPTPRAKAAKAGTPAPLDAVCACAMAKAPQDRYASAAELARDIERWLADEPVSVYRDPWPSRAARWARRHKALVASGAALLVAAVAALSAITVLVQQEQLRTATAYRQADTNFQRARHAMDQMLAQIVEKHVADLPLEASERRALLEQALKFYRDFSDQKPTSPELQYETARAYHQVGDISRLLESHEDAQNAYQHAISLLEDLLRQRPEAPDVLQHLAHSHNDRGESLRLTGDARGAIAAYETASALQEQLAARFPKSPEYFQERARSLYNLGLALRADDQTEQAERAYGEAVRLLSRLVDDHPRHATYRQELARAHINLGILLKDAKRADESERNYGRAIELLTGLASEAPKNREYRRELASGYVNLGNLLLANKERRADAERALRESLGRFEALAADYPSIPTFRKELANSANSLGSFYISGGLPNEAKAQWTRAEEILQGLADAAPEIPEHASLLGATESNLATIALSQNDPATARALLEEAIEHQRAALSISPNHPGYRQFLRNHYWILVETLLRMDRHAEAAVNAAQLPRVMPEGWEEHLRAARMIARCLPLAAKDEALESARREAVQAEYVAQALDNLERAVERGFQEGPKLDGDEAWTPLHDDPRFQEIRGRMGSQAG